MYSREGIIVILSRVHLWDNNLKEERNILVVAENLEDAEDEALENDYLECAEAEEVTEIKGYKVIFEKIEK
jgi:hypothetical protein